MADIAKILFENVGAAIAIIVVLALAIIAVFKVNIKFDLNDFLKARRAKHAKKAQHYCAHMEFQKRNDGAVCIGWFESPPGTHAWICRTCQLAVNHIDEEEQQKNSEYWLKNPKIYTRNRRRYNYHAKRSI